MMSKQKWTNFNFLIYLKIDPTISIMFFFSNSNQNILLWIHLVSYCLNTSHRSCQLFKKNIKIDKMYFSIWPVYLISVDCAEWWNNLYEVCVCTNFYCYFMYPEVQPKCTIVFTLHQALFNLLSVMMGFSRQLYLCISKTL